MDKECSCNDLKKIVENYEKLSKKYKLPEFDKLSEDFDAEKILEKPAVLLLRDIRRIMIEKISAYMHLFETFINPSSAPMLIILMLKNLSEEDKKNIEEIYKKFAKMEITSMKLDTVYSEKKEADLIKEVYDDWQKLKDKVLNLMNKFDSNFDINSKSSSRGYFG